MLLRSPCACCGATTAAPVCPACASGLGPAPALAPPLHVDACVAALEYDGARRILTSLKNGQRRDLTGWLADRMVERVDVPRGAVVTWAPTTPARRRARGFDQAELLARAAARRWEVPCRPLLVRAHGAPQAGRGAGERRANPSFSARRPVPPSVVLVDDVTTTGATLTAAARALRPAGAVTILGVVAARAAGARAAGARAAGGHHG